MFQPHKSKIASISKCTVRQNAYHDIKWVNTQVQYHSQLYVQHLHTKVVLSTTIVWIFCDSSNESVEGTPLTLSYHMLFMNECTWSVGLCCRMDANWWEELINLEFSQCLFDNVIYTTILYFAAKSDYITLYAIKAHSVLTHIFYWITGKSDSHYGWLGPQSSTGQHIMFYSYLIIFFCHRHSLYHHFCYKSSLADCMWKTSSSEHRVCNKRLVPLRVGKGEV